jgi:hypothetical protein
MGIFKNLFLVVVLAIAYVTYLVLSAMDYTNPVTLFGTETCQIIGREFVGVEDVTWYNDRYAIGISDDKLELF